MDRISEENHQQLEFMKSAFDGLSERVTSSLHSLQTDIRKQNLDHDEVVRRLGDLERQVIDTRETAQRASIGEAARGAAAGASLQAIGPSVSQALSAQAKKLNRPQWYALSGVGLLWLTTFVDKAPTLFKWLEGVWRATTGLEK